MAWSNNNLAHIYTHGAFTSLRQYPRGRRDFAEAGKVKVSRLQFYPSATAGPEIRKQAATAMAANIDGIMNQWVLGTMYESGFGPTKSIRTIALVLADDTKTVTDVGEAVDRCFFFAGEIHNG